KRRNQLHEVGKDTAPLALAATGLSFTGLKPPLIVSAFYPFRSEISTLPLLEWLAAEGWRTALPIVLGPGVPLQFRAWAPGDEMGKGEWDIPIPLDTAPEVLPDVLFVPLLSFDRAGYRLGYGGGFYDRTLAKLRAIKPVTAIGTAYAGQEVDFVPRGEYDAPLDWILTEEGPIQCG
ncbi:MAG: 5-formyltetrahydrofolate cyclo-ligase, partial [Aestuariivirgaceae bacterium]|nr:5-formyltetrahydrofolate cyclo-ligase [Aestuariivirgaceae bacterium]